MIVVSSHTRRGSCTLLSLLLLLLLLLGGAAAQDWGCDALEAAGAFDGVTLSSPSGALSLTFLPYGGTVQSLRVPSAAGVAVDVLLGFDDASQYCRGTFGNAGHPYFGALIGRVANRISRGSFALDGATYETPINEPPPSGGNDTLHGGTFGFDRRVWAIERLNSSAARLSYTSPDGEMGFPGELRVSVTYTLTEKSWTLEYSGASAVDTVFAPTQHAYWNLNGGKAQVLEHLLSMPTASRFVEVNPFLLPTGAVGSVKDAASAFLDFTIEHAVGRDINATTRYAWGTGYDNAWIFDGWTPGGPVVEELVRVFSPLSGIGMTVSSDQPSVQVYSGNFLNGSIPQKRDQNAQGVYEHWGALAIEMQHFPDSVNNAQFPTVTLKAGATYSQTTVYSFFTTP
jgi:aldose 1-epimerase